MGHLPKRKPMEIWFEDEARIGQKNGIVRQWARRGTRPRQPADQRYESACLFGAICPARSVGAGLAMPYADTQAMQLHLEDPEGSSEQQNQPGMSPAVFMPPWSSIAPAGTQPTGSRCRKTSPCSCCPQKRPN